MRSAGWVWPALVVGLANIASAQGLAGGPITSNYARRLAGQQVKAPIVKAAAETEVAVTAVKRIRARGARGVRGGLLQEQAGRAVEVTPDWPQRLKDETKPAKLRAIVRSMGRRAADLTDDDVRALERIARSAPHRRHAAPELRNALREVGRRHPDAETRERAASAADDLELTSHLVELRRHVETMRKAGKRGVEIWSEIAKRSVEYHKDRSDLTETQKIDAVIADLAALFNGPDALRHLQTYEKTFGQLPWSDPNVDTMIRALQRRDLNAAFAPRVDTKENTDFRPEFRDGTAGQVYHTNFFVLLGYAAAVDDMNIVNSVNIYHETVDAVLQGGGGSIADFRASLHGTGVGYSLRRLRDGDSANVTARRALLSIPSLIGTQFSDHPQDFTHPWGPEGPDYSGLLNVR